MTDLDLAIRYHTIQVAKMAIHFSNFATFEIDLIPGDINTSSFDPLDLRPYSVENIHSHGSSKLPLNAAWPVAGTIGTVTRNPICGK